MTRYFFHNCLLLFQLFSACLGASNPAYYGKFVGDPARKEQDESCNSAYVNNSLMCRACGAGYSHGDLGGKCDTCPSAWRNTFLAVAGGLFGVSGLIGYIYITIANSKTDADAADAIVPIGLSFVQVVTLLTTFPVQWPAIFVSIFQVGGAVTVLGQHLVNLKCMVDGQSDADVFFTTHIGWAVIPFLLLAVSAFLWLLLFKCCCCKRYFANQENLLPNIRGSSVALLYLIWPTLCTQTFALFACRTQCNSSVLSADFEETCWEGRHMFFVFAIGVPSMAVYVLGLPLGALVAIGQLKKRAFRKGQHLSESKGHKTWGLFYSAFRENVWWWEGTVALRKIAIAAIGIFGASMQNMQIHLTSMLIVGFILLTSNTRPFLEGKLQSMLQTLEMSLLVGLWLTLWAAAVFIEYPKCEDESSSSAIGETLLWCDVLSIAVGVTNILCTFAVVLCFLSTKINFKKCKFSKFCKCFSCCAEEEVFQMQDNPMLGSGETEAIKRIAMPKKKTKSEIRGARTKNYRKHRKSSVTQKNKKKTVVIEMTRISNQIDELKLTVELDELLSHLKPLAPIMDVRINDGLVDINRNATNGAADISELHYDEVSGHHYHVDPVTRNSIWLNCKQESADKQQGNKKNKESKPKKKLASEKIGFGQSVEEDHNFDDGNDQHSMKGKRNVFRRRETSEGGRQFYQNINKPDETTWTLPHDGRVVEDGDASSSSSSSSASSSSSSSSSSLST